MALTNSWPGVNVAATTTDARRNLAGMLVKDTTGTARSGIFPAHANALVSARSDMNVDIAVFTGAAVQFGGPVLIANDGVAQLPSALVSPGAGTNYYVIYAKQNESAAPGTDANNNRVFGAQLSTTSVAVARAALPPGALELGTVEMPTGKTATNQGGVIITPTFQYTATEGGVVLLRNQAEQDAWSPHNGAPAFRLDTSLGLIRVGGAWVTDGERVVAAPAAVMAGSVPPVGARIIRQAGLVSVITNAAGDVGFNYPTAFPNGVISASLQRHNYSVFGPTFEVLYGSQSLASLAWRIYNSNGTTAGAGGTFGYAYEAIGW